MHNDLNVSLGVGWGLEAPTERGTVGKSNSSTPKRSWTSGPATPHLLRLAWAQIFGVGILRHTVMTPAPDRLWDSMHPFLRWTPGFPYANLIGPQKKGLHGRLTRTFLRCSRAGQMQTGPHGAASCDLLGPTTRLNGNKDVSLDAQGADWQCCPEVTSMATGATPKSPSRKGAEFPRFNFSWVTEQQGTAPSYRLEWVDWRSTPPTSEVRQQNIW